MKSCLNHKNFFVVLVCMATLGLTNGVVNGKTIIVQADGSGDYPTIQAAIDGGNDGDEIVCADGTYTGNGNRDIDFLGKAIIVKSENGSNNCIIDCNGTESEPHRGFRFTHDEDGNSVVAGVTIQKGYAPYEHYYGASGGAIFCKTSSPTITNCTITDNTAIGSGGGGIYCWKSHPKIINCCITENSSGSGAGMLISNDSNPRLINCVFSKNAVPDAGGAMSCTYRCKPYLVDCTFIQNLGRLGGAIYCTGKGGPTLVNCTFTENTSISFGGAIECFEASPTLTNCTFSHNIAQYGGAMYNRVDASGAVIAKLTNCIFIGNRASKDGGAMHNLSYGSGGLFTTKPTIINCIFVGNQATNRGGGIYNSKTLTTVVNCTFSDNSAANGGGMYNKSGAIVGITSSIAWDNTIGQIIVDSGTTNVSYSCIEGGFGGISNINLDPLFADPNGFDGVPSTSDDNLRLSVGSPCINAGDPNYVAGPDETDLDGLPRIIGGRVDMGAYEFNHLPIACIVGGDRTIEAESGCKASVILAGTCSSDADSTPGTNDDINDFDWYEVIDACDPNSDIFLGSGEVIECNLPLGEHDIVLEVTDKAGAFNVNEVTITVEDTTQPEFSLTVEPSVLWPANHKMVEITPTWEVSDNCDEWPEVTLVSITMNEDDDGKGDGHTSDDIQIGDEGIWLRAERSGSGSGRIYTITYQAVDESGNVTVGSAGVTVPHGRR